MTQEPPPPPSLPPSLAMIQEPPRKQDGRAVVFKKSVTINVILGKILHKREIFSAKSYE